MTYAFNKRFRPTLWKGIPYTTVACLLGSLLLWAFALGAVFQLHDHMMAIMLAVLGLVGMVLGIQAYRSKDRVRLRWSRFVGRRDQARPPLGL